MAPLTTEPGKAWPEREACILLSLDFAVSRSTLGAKACRQRCLRTSAPVQCFNEAARVDSALCEAASEKCNEACCNVSRSADVPKSNAVSASDTGESGTRPSGDMGLCGAQRDFVQKGVLSRGLHRGLRAAGCLLHRVPRFKWNRRKCQETWSLHFKDISPASPPSDSCPCPPRRSKEPGFGDIRASVDIGQVDEYTGHCDSSNEGIAMASAKSSRATSPAASSSTGVPSPGISSPAASSSAASSPASSSAGFSASSETSAKTVEYVAEMLSRAVQPRTPPPRWPPPQAPAARRRACSEPRSAQSQCTSPAASAPVYVPSASMAAAAAATPPRSNAPKTSGPSPVPDGARTAAPAQGRSSSSPRGARASLSSAARAASDDAGHSTSLVTTGLDVSMLTTLGPMQAERTLLAALRRVSAVKQPSLRRRLLKDVQRRVHPDKWPTEKQELATRLFQVLQEHREAALAGRLAPPRGSGTQKL